MFQCKSHGTKVFFFAFSKTLLETRFRCILDRAPNFYLWNFFFFGGLETIIDGPQGKHSTRKDKKKGVSYCAFVKLLIVYDFCFWEKERAIPCKWT